MKPKKAIRPKQPIKNPFKEDGRLKQERRQAMQRFNRPKMMPFTRRGI